MNHDLTNIKSLMKCHQICQFLGYILYNLADLVTPSGFLENGHLAHAMN